MSYRLLAKIRKIITLLVLIINVKHCLSRSLLFVEHCLSQSHLFVKHCLNYFSFFLNIVWVIFSLVKHCSSHSSLFLNIIYPSLSSNSRLSNCSPSFLFVAIIIRFFFSCFVDFVNDQDQAISLILCFNPNSELPGVLLIFTHWSTYNSCTNILTHLFSALIIIWFTINFILIRNETMIQTKKRDYSWIATILEVLITARINRCKSVK